MITLCNISKNEFEKYESYFISDYSKEISENYGYPIEQSLVQAKRELHKAFPNGEASTGNHLVSLKLSQTPKKHTIGYLWFSIKEGADHAFICDFYIEDNHRSKGYGKAALQALEAFLLKSDIEQIRLRVAYLNNRALKLYKEIGFTVTGLNMIKRLKIQDS